MKPKDIPYLTPLTEQLGYSCTLDDLTLRFNILCEDPSVGLFVGELANGSIIAFMQTVENCTLLSGKRAEIDALVIDEKFRGQGFGKKMIEAADEWARSKTLQKIRLGCRTSRTDTHEFYKKNGFTIEKTWFVFSKPTL